MLIYLDNCCFNRPFDDQKQIRIQIETEAKLFIQGEITDGKYSLAWSYILDYENEANPFPERKETKANWKKKAIANNGETRKLLKLVNILYDNEKNLLKINAEGRFVGNDSTTQVTPTLIEINDE